MAMSLYPIQCSIWKLILDNDPLLFLFLSNISNMNNVLTCTYFRNLEFITNMQLLTLI